MLIEYSFLFKKFENVIRFFVNFPYRNIQILKKHRHMQFFNTRSQLALMIFDEIEYSKEKQ